MKNLKLVYYIELEYKKEYGFEILMSKEVMNYKFKCFSLTLWLFLW